MALAANWYQNLLTAAGYVGDTDAAQACQSQINAAIAAATTPGLLVVNKTGGTLAKGKAVTIVGYDAGTGYVSIGLADNTNVGKPAVGVLSAALTDGSTTSLAIGASYTITASGFDTRAGSVGDPIYLSTSGALTLTKPTYGGAAFAQVVGVVATSAASGKLEIFPESPQPRVYVDGTSIDLTGGGALEVVAGLQTSIAHSAKALFDVDTITAASGAVSVSTGTTFLNPSATGSYTIASGANGQHKWIVLVATQDVTVATAGGSWTGGAPGDYAHAIYSTVAADWLILDHYEAP